MPIAIKDVVDGLARLRQNVQEEIELLVQGKFARLIANDPSLQEARRSLFSWSS
jgi:hypothetical protein